MDEKKLLTWRCNSCTTYKSVYESSFFSLFKKSPKIIIAIIKCWAAQMTVSKTCQLIQLHSNENVGNDMVSCLIYKMRQICTLSLDKSNIKLGGVGHIVEIDESLYAKVKHWKSKDLCRVQHKTVNHSLNFVEPMTKTHTNRIESLCRACKHKFKEIYGCKRNMIQSYIDEFILSLRIVMDELVNQVNGDLETDAEYSVDSEDDSDSVETENDQCSETGSVFVSLNGDIDRVDDFDSSEESCFPGDSEENETRDDEPTLAGSSSVTKKNNEMNDDTDNDDVDDVDTDVLKNLQTLNKKFKNVTLLDPKSKSNYYEKKSQEISEAIEEVQIEIKKVLIEEQELNYVYGFIGEEKVECLIDTGSKRTLIN
ncbi:unnamed protein product [Brachionus calyciflorus]|uniref:Uncharacterized protein n=1 Tax=Brachionus calyciflorus TaxID=104777 RepID=A0A814PD77_9BILA|nr:unnamed protein product [Brachionus calyciflorus]